MGNQGFIHSFLGMDTSLFYFINRKLACRFLDVTMPILTDLHKSTWVVGAIILFSLTWILRKGRKAIALLLLLLLATAFADLLNAFAIKKEFKRERPQVVLSNVELRSPASGYSFPSNHATNCFTLATIVSCAFPEIKGFAYFCAILIAFSRVYVGVHFPLDVLAAALVGIFLGRIFWWLGRGTIEQLSLTKEPA